MSRKELNRAYIALGLVSFFWGTTFIAARIGTQHMPGLFLSAVRQFSSGFLMVSFFLLKGYKLPDWKSLKHITIQGIFLLSLANGLLTWSLEYINSGFAAIISATVPLFVTLFSVWLLQHARLTLDDRRFSNWFCRSSYYLLRLFTSTPGQISCVWSCIGLSFSICLDVWNSIFI